MKIFDNSNLAESYSGVTTPLTFSFARYVYQEVYINFCEMMGVSQRTIKTNATIFPEMVVCIGNQMYYDLVNWYKLISFMPGYSFNRGFLEEMMGVDQRADLEKTQPKSWPAVWFIYFPKTLWQVIKIAWSFVFMGQLVKNFSRDFDTLYLKHSSQDLSADSEKGLKDRFRYLTSNLVVRWRVPIANDFAVMISTGVVRQLFKRWLGAEDAYQYLYIGGTASLISLDPGLAIMDLIAAIREDQKYLDLFLSDRSPRDIIKILASEKDGVISKKIEVYIKKYGDRIPGELKLESKSLSESPEVFIRMVTNALKNGELQKRQDFQHRDLESFPLSCFKKNILTFFLRWAKKAIRLREETRFKRTLIFGYARKIFIELGKRYAQRGLLEEQNDIFYLTLDEVLADWSTSNIDNKEKIRLRRNNLLFWRDLKLPRRIETEQTINDFEKEFSQKAPNQKNVSQDLKGVVVSTCGLEKLSGKAIVMKEFDSEANFTGKIIITCHTDPGWSLAFPLIKGLVVERGGMLSHAAIVARELGIPCLVGVENATGQILSGEEIELDLVAGKIIKKV